jgi:hypothetical protein
VESAIRKNLPSKEIVMKELLIAWILGMMVTVVNPHRTGETIPEARESFAQADERYANIANDIVEASYREDVKPVFAGPYGRAKTAMLVASIFYMESGFRRDVDLGIGRARTRRAGLNDFGRSWCMGQINLGRNAAASALAGEEKSASVTAEGWSGPDLLADRQKCVIATIGLLRSSFGSCAHLPSSQRLAAYAAGTCDSVPGQMASTHRHAVFRKWVDKDRPSVKDAEILAIGKPESAIVASSN